LNSFLQGQFSFGNKCCRTSDCSETGCVSGTAFPQHHVNVEYNRHGLHPKKLNLPAYGGNKLVLPDVVVHRQGHDHENLLVIQIKKETNNESREYDRAVITGMKEAFGYTWGVPIDLPAGPGATSREAHFEWL
jgi:hypothetical protein